MADYAGEDANAIAQFAGVDGTKVAEERLMYPDLYYIHEAKQATTASAVSRSLGRPSILQKRRCKDRDCDSNADCTQGSCTSCMYNRGLFYYVCT